MKTRREMFKIKNQILTGKQEFGRANFPSECSVIDFVNFFCLFCVCKGSVDANQNLVLNVQMLDGTYYPNVLTTNWMSINFTYFIENSNAISVSQNGMISLKENSFEPVTLNVRTCELNEFQS